jgi:hypothetical protein
MASKSGSANFEPKPALLSHWLIMFSFMEECHFAGLLIYIYIPQYIYIHTHKYQTYYYIFADMAKFFF